jgi:hypothetical protein
VQVAHAHGGDEHPREAQAIPDREKVLQEPPPFAVADLDQITAVDLRGDELRGDALHGGGALLVCGAVYLPAEHVVPARQRAHLV